MTLIEMLDTAARQSFERLQRAHELHSRVYAEIDALELFANDEDRFKLINRHVRDCETSFHRATEDLRRAQKAAAAEYAETEVPVEAVAAAMQNAPQLQRERPGNQPEMARPAHSTGAAPPAGFTPAPDSNVVERRPPQSKIRTASSAAA